MQALIQDLLELSRVGRSQTASELVDLEAVLEDIRGEVQLSYPDAPIAIGPISAAAGSWIERPSDECT